MEKICPHCNKTFTVKRIDSIYCSRSCRQMAYMDRKLKSELPTLQIDHVPVIELKEDNTNAGVTDPYTAVDAFPKIKNPANEVVEEECQPSHSVFVDALIDLSNERHHPPLLKKCLLAGDLSTYWISLRLRCLLECVLVFSEMKYLKVADLMEICNAFTYMLRSKYYTILPDEFPYTDNILTLQKKLKGVCFKVKNIDQIKFRLTQADKMELILMRYELAKYIPKNQFNQLDFESG